MSITTLTLRDVPNVIFPVFGLPKGTIRKNDGLIFFTPEDRGEFLLDDKNVSARTLGLRRLKTPQRHEKLRINKCYRELRELLNSKDFAYIDNLGRLFQYERSLYCDIKYHAIEEVLNCETYSAVKVEGISKPFEIPRPPSAYLKYAGILYYHGHPWMIYDYSEKAQKTRRRKM